MAVINVNYTDFSKGLAGGLDTTRTVNRTYGLNKGETGWAGWITGTDAEITANSNFGPNAGLIVVSVDGGAKVAVATPVSTKYTVFSALPDVPHFVEITFGSAYSTNAYISTDIDVLEVTGISPSVSIPVNKWINVFDSLTSSAGAQIANDTGYVPALVPAADYNSSMLIRTNSTKGMFFLGDNSSGYISIDGAAPTKYNSGGAESQFIEVDLPSGTHDYLIWGDGVDVNPSDIPLSFGVDGTFSNVPIKRSLDIYGDSIAFGTGTSPDIGLVDVFPTASHFGYAGATVAVSGETTGELKLRLPTALSQVSVGANDVAVLAIGRNNVADFNATVQADYLDCINQIKLVYGKVICRGILGGSFVAINAIIEGIVTTLADPNVTYVSVDSWSDVTYADGVHPDAAGYAAITEHQKTDFASVLTYAFNKTFGNLTSAGYGGVSVDGASITSGDTSGHWQIVGGVLSPSAAGATADLNLGPYDLALDDETTYNISVVPDAYSVAPSTNESQLELTSEGASLGQSVLLRDGTYNSVLYDMRIRPATTPSGTFDGTNHVHIKPHSGETVNIYRLQFSNQLGGCRYFRVSGLNIKAKINSIFSACTILVDSDNIIIEDNAFSVDGATAETISTAANFSITDNTSTNGPSFCTIQNNTFTNVSGGVGLRGEDNTILGNTIDGFYRDAFTISPPCARAVVSFNKGLNVKTAYIAHTVTAITFGATTLVTVTDASGVSIADDFVLTVASGADELIGVIGDITGIAGNDLTVNINSTGFTPYVSGGAGQSRNIHSDFIQGNFGTATAGEIDDIVIQGNTCTHGVAEPYWSGTQGIFLEDNNVDMNNLVCEGNIMETPAAHGITLRQCVNASIRNNVVVETLGSVAAGSAGIRLTSTGSGNVIQNNIANLYDDTTTASDTSNNTTIDFTQVAYEAMFDSPPTVINTASDGVIDYAIKAGGPADLASPKQGAAGTGYINYVLYTVNIGGGAAAIPGVYGKFGAQSGSNNYGLGGTETGTRIYD